MSKFTTPKGKDIATFICPKTAYHRVKFVQGGELPVVLSGLYTSERIADIAITQYLEENKQPRVKD